MKEFNHEENWEGETNTNITCSQYKLQKNAQA